MFRASQASQRLLRLAPRASFASPVPYSLPRLQLQLQAPKLALATQKARFATKPPRQESPPPPRPEIDYEHERKIGEQLLKSDPSKVSAESSVRHVVGEGMPTTQDPQDVGGGLKHDLNIVKDTFRLTNVPRESYILGLAGTLPYLGTSVSTIFLAWGLSKDWPTGNAFYDAISVDHETARYLLGVLEPIQLGYGAVIISFLGAIHWGLEYAETKPSYERTRFRYGMGLAASVIAWPTLFMPVEYALTTQFMAFVALYFADARAATRGWAPYWYGSYRFLLTAVVGVAIFLSLVGRTKIGQHKRLTAENMERSGIVDHDTDWTKLEQAEKERLRKEKKEAEKKAKKEAKKKEQAEKEAKKGGRAAKKDEGNEKDDAKKADEDDSGKEDTKDDADEKDEKSDESKDDSENKDGKESKDDKKGEDDKDNNKDDAKEDSDGEGKDDGKDRKS
ncbi:Fc.00g095790.m01.CDS01 [Cosmosporella sp. VM-42]